MHELLFLVLSCFYGLCSAANRYTMIAERTELRNILISDNIFHKTESTSALDCFRQCDENALTHHRIDDRIYHLVTTVEGVDRDVWKLSRQRSLHQSTQRRGRPEADLSDVGLRAAVAVDDAKRAAKRRCQRHEGGQFHQHRPSSDGSSRRTVTPSRRASGWPSPAPSSCGISMIPSGDWT